MTIEQVLFTAVFAFSIIIAYTLGVRIGQKLSKKEEVKLPNLNPITAISNEIERHEERKEQDIMDVMLENINNYDGTGIGQKDIPR